MNSYWFLVEQGLDKLQDARAIRHSVFVEEQGFCNEFDEIDATAHHLVIYSGNTPMATGRVFQKADKQFTIGRVAVLKSYRGDGFGRIIMENLENQARVLGAETIVLSAQLHAKGFYEALGYQAQGEIYMDQHCPHITMEKSL
ncbi:GNAT family N-acetyltransferase [Clostridium minihomine]|uniref:GNAT family N-acetyltransferase n=1 Tax=Clostridium minihomine TaxID=2045012 RepID=UPI000C76D6C0|nr:GNAT family N-acetyltransferase [Clostridium minihomine]